MLWKGGTNVVPTGEDAPLLEYHQSRNYTVGVSRQIVQDFLLHPSVPFVRCDLAPALSGVEPSNLQSRTALHTSGDRRHGQGVHGELEPGRGIEPRFPAGTDTPAGVTKLTRYKNGGFFVGRSTA